MKVEKILIENIRLPHKPGASGEDAEAIETAVRQIRKAVGKHPAATHIYKKSIDARRRGQIQFVYTIYAEMETGSMHADLPEKMGWKRYTEPCVLAERGKGVLHARPVIVGFGPAGMFAALLLAQAGLRPLVLERGADAVERTEAVGRFTAGGGLQADANIQFGAGGAGTFSDGKLTTRIHDPRIAYVLQTLVELGAPEDILWKAKPHIGTDILVDIVSRTDQRIRSLGGEIRYHSRVAHVDEQSVLVNGEKIPYGVLILATGHSARDLYMDLLASSFCVEPKPFSVGVRAEHLQSWLDTAMFGEFAGDETLGHAEYQLSHRRGERGCYSFCMCPGGEVVAAASEAGGVVTNGMSRRARDGKNANAALCVSVLPSDYGNTPAGAIAFQRRLEQAAFAAGGGDYTAPMQTVGDFLSGKSGTEPTKILPTYRNGGVIPVDLHNVLPPFVTDMLAEGLGAFDRSIRGYAASCVPLTGVETRTSAPVRILRTEALHAVGHTQIYPCGEGAGYAGGIVSAAVDGCRVAAQILSLYGTLAL